MNFFVFLARLILMFLRTGRFIPVLPRIVSLKSRLSIVAMIASVLPRILSNTEMSLFYSNASEYCF
jgi:hypothetical protein